MPTQPPVLIRDPNRPSATWNIKDIYTGVDNPGRYVPNVDDLVIDYDEGMFRVIAVDETTGLSTLDPWDGPSRAQDADDLDVMMGQGPNNPESSFLIYHNQKVTPHTLSIDARQHMYGSTVSHYKVFKGGNIGIDGTVISAYYDNGGNFLGDNIPMELVATTNINNTAIKTPKTGYTMQKLNDGELVTAVFYDDEGETVSVARYKVANTGFVRSSNASHKYVQSIDLESPFMSSSNPNLIQFPMNMIQDSLNLMGVVTYSDGSKVKLPADGTKFQVHGLDQYIATIQGQELPVVLVYNLSNDESTYMAHPSTSRHVAKQYTATTLPADLAYNVKLFAYPVWMDELHGYRLEVFLCNLDRQRIYNVTNYVQAAQGSRAFDPLDYGTLQNIALSIDMSRVDPSYARYRHVQTLGIALLTEGDEQLVDNWVVHYTPNQDPPYGRNLQAEVKMVNQDLWQVKIGNQIPNQTEWLDQMFYASQPLFDPETESYAPRPNYFAIAFENHRFEFPLSRWNDTLELEQMPSEGKPIFIEWMRRSDANDLQLAVTALSCHHYAVLNG